MQTLRDLFRKSGHRPFKAQCQANRRVAMILGFGPNGQAVGWWDGYTEILSLDPEKRDWVWVCSV